MAELGTIELLYWEGCPSHPQALEELRQVLRELGHDDAGIVTRRVETEEEAARLQFCGSPTIRVGGADPLPPPPDEPTGLTCRIYWTAAGRPSPTPDPDLLRAALARLIGFTLPDTDGTPVSLRSGAAATVVVFTCNHCPYALAWHERINAVARDYAAAGVRMLQISSNDAERFPRDAPAAMRARVQAGEFAGPYLYDASQDVARAWGARVTPDVFVLDGELRLAYRGAPDADHRDESLNAAWLRAALDAVLAGRAVEEPVTEPVGCSIKWR
jgi:peroxiredoxin